MGVAIESFLQGPTGVRLFEGPTGVGKSIAYLVPVVQWLKEGAPSEKRRAVISTGRKALQEQLAGKDIPHVLGVLGAVRHASLKGKSNYLCQHRLEEWQQQPDSYRYNLAPLLAWAGTDPHGDLENHHGSLEGIRQKVCVENCDSLHCKWSTRCGYITTKTKAANAQLLVVNHSLLATDLMLSHNVLGEYQVLVCDEGHALPKSFREALTVQFHRGQLIRLHRRLEQLQMDTLPDAHTLERSLRPLYAFIEKAPPAEIFKPDPSFKEPAETFLGEAAAFMAKHLDFVDQDSGMPAELPEWLEQVRNDRGTTALLIEGRMLAGLLGGMADAIRRVLLPVEGPIEYLPLIQVEGDRQRLDVTPLEVGGILTPALRAIGHAVITSATLGVGNDPRGTLVEFGLPHATGFDRFPSSFDHRRNSALYLPEDAPNADFKNLAASRSWWTTEIRELVCASRGGAFILCASRADMDWLYDVMTREGAFAQLQIMRQEQGIDPWITEFRRAPNPVLLGVDSLWEGVDLPGLGLRLVIIPRLPFPNIKDPLLNARSRYRIERLQTVSGLDVLLAKSIVDQELYTLPMCLKMIQGAGRLLRTTMDRGVVAVLDGRLRNGARDYSAKLLAALPHPKVHDRAGVLTYLDRLASAHEKASRLAGTS
jgi:ATP-dependent DNA helicase DinG